MEFLSSGPRDTGALIFSFLFMIGGGLGVVACVRGLLRIRASKHWPMVEGKIIESGVKEFRLRGRMHSQPILIYEYWVEGQRYTGSVLSFGAVVVRESGEELARELMSKYPLGKSVPVYYNPRKPSVAALEPGEEGTTVVGGVAAAAIFVVGLLIYLWKVRS